MSEFHIVEGSGSGAGKKYFTVFIGSKAVSEPFTTREQAEGYMALLEQRELDAIEEERAENNAPPKQRSSPRMG